MKQKTKVFFPKTPFLCAPMSELTILIHNSDLYPKILNPKNIGIYLFIF